MSHPNRGEAPIGEVNNTRHSATTSRTLSDRGSAAIGSLVALVVVGVVAAPLVAIALLSTVAAAAGAGSTSATIAPPSPAAASDIPPTMLASYISASLACEGLPWTLLAAIGKVDSDHGRIDATVIDRVGRAAPEMVGPPLDGISGRALVRDTDRGELDHDNVYDRAIGPMRLLPSAWRAIGIDGNDDGVADPQNAHDAIATTVRQICPDGTLDDIRAAIARHDPSATYVGEVVEWARRYTGIATQPTVAGYALPLPRTAIGGRDRLTQPHHDYPAIDIGVPVGTPVYAITSGRVVAASDDSGRCGGTVIVAGDDGATYTYCHLSNVAVTTSARVDAGASLGASGGQPGTRGAGTSTGPHLHIAVRVNGIDVCPHAMLLAIFDGSPVRIDQLRAGGCTAP